MSHPARRTCTFLLAALLATACGAGGADGPEVANPEAPAPTVSATTGPEGWDAVLAEADGQTVRWWLYGGDERINRYIDDEVVPRAAERGVTLERVPVDDTASVVQRVVAEQRAGKDEGGSVDLIWINGENFAAGKEAELWLEDWAGTLPNARWVDGDDPTIATDFGVPVDGQESPWSRAAFVFAHDRERTPEPPTSFPDLLAHARENPGRITYPAPPDFTGAAFVRLAVQTLGEDEAFALLAELRPLQWRGGDTFPADEAELNQLFGDGQVDLAMSYDPNVVATGVAQGQFADSARPFLFDGGSLQNVSYVTIPANAAHRAGAMVVADLLLDPELQAIKADPAGLGIPTVLDMQRLSADQRALFESTLSSPHTLADFGRRVAELPPEEVVRLEERWQQDVLRGAG